MDVDVVVVVVEPEPGGVVAQRCCRQLLLLLLLLESSKGPLKTLELVENGSLGENHQRIILGGLLDPQKSFDL